MAQPHCMRLVEEGALVAGRYVVEGPLGEGSTAFVARARHVVLGQEVAIKFLLPEARGEGQRFLREAQNLAAMENVHLPRILDFGEGPTGPFMVMELLRGGSLADELRDTGPLTVAHAVDCILQACDALVEAHDRGLVHRDLKPDNLVFDKPPGKGPRCLKVLDFGTATSACELTATHAFIGTPLYMAPEQTVSAREADARADIWSLGAILYELLTGSSPFDGTTVFHVLTAVREWTPTPLSELRSDVPRELEAVVFACLEKAREARISSARELALRLAPFASSARARSEARGPLPSRPLPSPPLPSTGGSARPRRRGAAYGAALLLGAFGVGAAGAAAARQHSIPPATAVPSVATTHEAGLSGRPTALPPVSLTVRAAVPGSS